MFLAEPGPTRATRAERRPDARGAAGQVRSGRTRAEALGSGRRGGGAVRAGLLGHSPVPSTRPGPFRFGASSRRRSQPEARGAALTGPRPSPAALALVALSLPLSSARRQVLRGPAQLRRTDACHFLAASCHPSSPRRVASFWSASSSLPSPRSRRGHLWWLPVGSCPGPLGGPSRLASQTQIAARCWQGRRGFTNPRRSWGGKGPGAERVQSFRDAGT